MGKNRGAVIVKCVYTVQEFTELFGLTKITVNKIIGIFLYWPNANKRVQTGLGIVEEIFYRTAEKNFLFCSLPMGKDAIFNCFG